MEVDDQQLLELIYRYDSQMSIADQEYLLQIENRDDVVRTLQAKIMEREQFGHAGEDYFYQEDASTPPIYYGEHEIVTEEEREKLGLTHKNLGIQKHICQSSCISKFSEEKQSTEDQAYDSEFEENLASFKDMISSIQPEDYCHFSHRMGRKLIPNVTAEWITKLRRRLKESRYYISTKEQPVLKPGLQMPTNLTTSTAGMSFNSPPATEREQHYYEGEYADEEVDYAHYYCEDQPEVFKRNSYMNI